MPRHCKPLSRFRLLALAAAACVAAGALTSCGSPQAAPVESSAAPTANAQCLQGAWNVDVGLIARDAAQQTPEYVKGSATGAITVTFVGPNLNIAYAMNAEFPQDPPSTVWRLAITGASSATYTATDSILSTSNANNTVKVSKTVVVDGAVTTQSNTTKQNQAIVDFVDGPLAYTCSATTLTLANGQGFEWTAARKP